MSPTAPLRSRGYLVHSAPGAATPTAVANMLRTVADALDELPGGVGEVVDMTVTPAFRHADDTTCTTYFDTVPAT